MKKLLLLILCVFISACETIPVTGKFPTAPDKLMAECGQLNTIDKDEVYLSEYTKTVVKNYQLYHKCSSLVSSWQEWYKEQKENFEKATKK